MSTLTDRQREVLGYVQRGMTVREICTAIGASSTNGVNDHLWALVRKGALAASDERFAKTGRYAVTAAGLSELGLACCPTCAGSGTVAA